MSLVVNFLFIGLFQLLCLLELEEMVVEQDNVLVVVVEKYKKLCNEINVLKKEYEE